MKPSRYNFIVPSDDKLLLYNSLSGAFYSLTGKNRGEVKELLKNGARLKNGSPLFQRLVEGKFLINDDLDEVKMVQAMYHASRHHDTFTLTVAPTMSCNLSCGYCYENKSPEMMEKHAQRQLASFFEKMLTATRQRNAQVDWYGGEPLLALRTITRLSAVFMRISEKHDCAYRSSIITNGTLLTPEAVRLLKKAGVDTYQVTIDGTREAHDSLRPFKNKEESSFKAIMGNLERIVGSIPLLVRMNVGRNNFADVLELLDEFAGRGWLDPKFQFYPHPAPIMPLTAACTGAGKSKLGDAEYFTFYTEFLSRLREHGIRLRGSGVYNFPSPRKYNCAAVSFHSYVVDPTGSLYKCGLTVGDTSKRVGTIFDPVDMENPNLVPWLGYDPLDYKECGQCKLLPACLGGCPYSRIYGNKVLERSECRFLRNNISDILRLHAS